MPEPSGAVAAHAQVKAALKKAKKKANKKAQLDLLRDILGLHGSAGKRARKSARDAHAKVGGPKVSKPPVFDGNTKAVPVAHFLVQLRAYVASCRTDEEKLGLAVSLASGSALTFWLAESRTMVQPSFADFCSVLERRFSSALVWRQAQEALFDGTSPKWLRQNGSVAEYYGRFKQLLAEHSQAPLVAW